MLMADDHLSDEEIAERCGVVSRTIWRWRTQPAMQTRIAEHKRLQARAIAQQGIAVRKNRIDALNRRAGLLERVIAERSTARDMQKVAGGKTGLLVRQVKAKRVVYEVDTGLLAELRAHEKQAAIETGQWEEKSIVTNEGAPVTVIEVHPPHG